VITEIRRASVAISLSAPGWNPGQRTLLVTLRALDGPLRALVASLRALDGPLRALDETLRALDETLRALDETLKALNQISYPGAGRNRALP